MLKHALFSKTAYVKRCPGHRNSKGELAEWCIYSHETGKILSSHTSEDAAKKHLQDMHAHSGSKTAVTYDYDVYVGSTWATRVFSGDPDIEAVKRSLIEHDGYSPNIVVRRGKPDSIPRGKPWREDEIQQGRRFRRVNIGARKRAYGYYNFEWQGNDALLLGPDKQTILLSGKAAQDFQTELERVEEELPHDVALEAAVNDFIKSYFDKLESPPVQ
jgi:hypothetical protein